MYCFQVDCNKYLNTLKSYNKKKKILKVNIKKKTKNLIKDRYSISYHLDYYITIEVNKTNHHTNKVVFLDMKDKAHKR